MKQPKLRAFALVLVIVLLALLVLVVVSLSALSRVDSALATVAVHRVQARQNALLALRVALGELQRLAGPDDRSTGTAGVAGVPPGAGEDTRHWCGVWVPREAAVSWLVSGASRSSPRLESVTETRLLVATGTLGADGTDKEHVRVGLLPVELRTRAAASALHGRYGYWVGDEGVKLSAALANRTVPVPGGVHSIQELIPPLDPMAPRLAQVLAYPQLAFVPSTAITAGALQANFHALGVAHLGVVQVGTTPAQQAGRLNLNTTTARFWRGVAATYNRLNPAEPLGITTNTFAARLRDRMSGPDEAAGKAAGAPYDSVTQFLEGDVLAAALSGSGVTPTRFAAVMEPWLCVRSDTFLIRAYGEVLNSADAAKVEARAWCEASVQRTLDVIDSPAGPLGRRFVVVSFRWLGPNDL